MALNSKVILEFFSTASHPLSYDEVVKSLSIAQDEREELGLILKELLDSGDLLQIKGGRYGSPSKMNLVVGRVQAHQDGFGFLIPNDSSKEDLFIRPRELKEVMHNDIVIAREQTSSRTKKTEAKIIRIVKRGNTEVVGRFERKKKFGYLIPLNQSILHDIYIPIEDSMDAPEGVIVCAEITKYPTAHLNPEGKIIKIFGEGSDPQVEIEVILHKYQINTKFPESALKEANKIELGITEQEIAKRTNLKETTTFTIDGETAKDFDDAVSIKKLDNGFKLLVSIADVSHYVKQGSALDAEALARGNSVYLLNRVTPMLPERLSNDLCSLRPNEDRLTFTADMEFDNKGDLVDYSFYKSVINSKYRLTYTIVKQILVDKDEALTQKYADIVGDLRDMETLALLLKKKRRVRGSIDFDLPEADIILDMQGKLENIIKTERNLAHQIIEEFMLAANETVAKHLDWLEFPSLYRIHEEPNEEKLSDFKELAFNLGYPLKETVEVRAKSLQEVLDKVKDQPEEMLINRVMLRTMKQAKYSPINQGHFALATEDYTHFTSPIRRYPDLVVHRMLAEALKGKKLSEQKVAQLEPELARIADHCSIQERVAEEAERELVDLKKVQFMVDKIGDEFEGFISGVNSFGFFVELCNIFVEGLVHVSTLTDDYYKFQEKGHTLLGSNLKKVFTIGDMVKVKVVKADIDKKQVDFELIEKIR